VGTSHPVTIQRGRFDTTCYYRYNVSIRYHTIVLIERVGISEQRFRELLVKKPKEFENMHKFLASDSY
jgi:hypothetical protein